MSTPDSPLPPTPPPSGADAPKPAVAKPAFKVTRSPFAPKLGGAAGPAPISIGGAAALSSVATPSSPTAARAPRAAPASRPIVAQDKPSVVGLVIDIAAAAVAVAFTIEFALSYFSS